MDLRIIEWINHLGRETRVDQFSFLLSWFPVFAGVFIVVLGFIYRKSPAKRKQIIIAVCIGIILFFVFNELLAKHIIVDFTGMRIRPYLAYPETIIPIGMPMSDNSFPSSHMASTAMVMTFMVWMFPRLRPLGLVYLLGMGFSRMHNGMHYPTDVGAGSLLGILYGLVGIRVSNKRPHKQK